MQTRGFPLCVISIHAPAKGATLHDSRMVQRSVISIHAPAKGATGGRVRKGVRRGISIHAPAKGATCFDGQADGLLKFQSTLPRRERPFIFCGIVRQRRNFNPRSREGSDWTDGKKYAVTSISIHAPAKGATRRCAPSASCSFGFQSTLPRRERPLNNQPSSVFVYFNPRSREGSDYQFRLIHRQRFLISIHAPAKGATSCVIRFVYCKRYFNPRSREGSDVRHCEGYAGGTYFNPRSREGSDLCKPVYLHREVYFNPRSREGSDPHRLKRDFR